MGSREIRGISVIRTPKSRLSIVCCQLSVVSFNKLKYMGYSNHDKVEWVLILSLEFGRRFGLTLRQAFNYLSRYKGIEFIDQHYDYCHTQSFQSMVTDIADYCHRKGGGLV